MTTSTSLRIERTAGPIGGNAERTTSRHAPSRLTLARTAAFTAALPLLLTSCNGGTPVEPQDVKEAIVSIVDETGTELGGGWTPRSGPYVETCSKEGGGPGAAYVYITVRAQAGDPASDTATVEALWRERGLTTEPYESGGESPTLGVRGTGGPTTRMDFYADADGYAITGVSQCADGDASTMQGDGE